MHIDLGDGFALRDFRAADLPSLLLHADNPKVARNLEDRFPHPYTRTDGNRWLASVAEQDPATQFAITADDEVVGGIGLRLLEDVYRRTAEIGYWLGEDFWGQGLATRAVLAFCPWIFDNFAVERIEARVFSSNPASCRVLEKAGFRREGRLRHSVLKMNVLMDQVVYAILRGESTTP
jgi:ribosomal-protein-alanine N-acetyltransferase